MLKTTFVVAFLAATVASAQAAPNSTQSARGAARSKIEQPKIERSTTKTRPAPAKVQNALNDDGRGWVPPSRLNPGKVAAAASMTSARAANPAAGRPIAPQTPSTATRVTRQASAHPASRSAEKRSARRVANLARRKAARSAAVRNAASERRDVSLNREIDVSPSAGAAMSGSIPAMVSQMARRQGVDPALAHAVVKVESRYQPRATGRGGYIGLMQLSYQTARGMGFRGSRQALYEPNANLTYGMKYLAGAVRKSGGNTCAAVSKYQGGHGVRGVTRAGAVYCAKVKRFMAEGIPASARVTADATAAAVQEKF
jgi:soluble lytic murein transglycosylase-like protein